MLASIKNVRTTHLLDPKLLGHDPEEPLELIETSMAEPADLFQIGEPST